MNQTPEQRAQEIWKRRQEAILQMRFSALARAGKSISAAYSTPTPALQYVK